SQIRMTVLFRRSSIGPTSPAVPASLGRLASPPGPRTAAAPVQCWLIHEAVELGGVVADDLLAGDGGQVAQLALDVFLRIGPHPVGVREVRAPHDVVLAELVQ